MSTPLLELGWAKKKLNKNYPSVRIDCICKPFIRLAHNQRNTPQKTFFTQNTNTKNSAKQMSVLTRFVPELMFNQTHAHIHMKTASKWYFDFRSMLPIQSQYRCGITPHLAPLPHSPSNCLLLYYTIFGALFHPTFVTLNASFAGTEQLNVTHLSDFYVIGVIVVHALLILNC